MFIYVITLSDILPKIFLFVIDATFILQQSLDFFSQIIKWKKLLKSKYGNLL